MVRAGRKHIIIIWRPFNNSFLHGGGGGKFIKPSPADSTPGHQPYRNVVAIHSCPGPDWL